MLQAHIYFDKDDLKGTEPLRKFLMHFLLENKVAGATSFMGYSGFGAHQKLKLPSRQFSFDERPMVITFIDEEEKVIKVLKKLREQYRGGLIITHKIETW